MASDVPYLPALLATLTGLLVACGDPAASAPASPDLPRTELSAPVAETGPCPPASLPPGYTLHTCFNFAAPIDGVWHGFIIGRSLAQPPETVNGAYTRTRLNFDYLLLTPTGYRRMEAGDIDQPPPSSDQTAFQAEYNGVEWFDVFRIRRGFGTRTGPMTIAIVRRTQTVRTQTAGLIRAVASLRTDGHLSPANATRLTRSLRLAIEFEDAGNSVLAREQLNLFISQVQGLLSQLTPLRGNPLITGAREVLARIAP